jgi:hypothetical protein
MRLLFTTCLLLLVFGPTWSSVMALNLLPNGGFEEGSAGWHLNPAASMATDALDLLMGPAGETVYSGRQALRVRAMNAHVQTPATGKADVEYALTFRARGGQKVTAADGAISSPNVSVIVYVYGKSKEYGRQVFLRNQLKRNFGALGQEWREFRLTLKVAEADVAGAEIFNLVFGIGGEVVLDDVALLPVESWRAKLLFHLPFDAGVDAANARGMAHGDAHGAVRLVEGRSGKAASFTKNAYLVYDAAGNFDQAEGTVAMWVKPYWSEHDGVPHCFFEVPGAGKHAANPDAGFTVTKGWTIGNSPNLCYFHTGTADYTWGQHIGGFPFGFPPNEWVHLTFSWSASGAVTKLYKNGGLLKVAPGPLGAKPPSVGRSMLIGARYGGIYGAEAAIDEVMVFNAALTDAEVAQLAGMDPAAVASVERAPMDSAHVNVVEMGWETPHIACNRPTALEPVNALFLIAWAHGRDIVELAQRYEMRFSAVTTHRNRTSFGFDDAYHANWADISTAAKIVELSARLDENPDVITIVNLDFARIPASLQQRILAMVQAGTGLVLIGPRHLPVGLSPLDEAGRAQILCGAPLSGMTDCYPEKQYTIDALGKALVQAYTLGAGRVALIRWYTDPGKNDPVGEANDLGISPRAASGVVNRQFEHRYNYYLALVGRCLGWAAKREPRLVWSTLPEDGADYRAADWPADGLEVGITWRGVAGHPAVLRAVLRNQTGTAIETREQPLQLAAGLNALRIPLALPPGGRHYLDLMVLSEGNVENWATVSFHVTRPEEVVAMTTARAHYQRGETATGRVQMRAPLPREAQLVMKAIDTYGREYARAVFPIRAGADAVDFAMPLAGTTSIANYLEADIVREGTVLGQGETVVYVPKPKDREFQSMIWGIYPLPDTMTGHRTYQQLRAAGFNSLLRWAYIGNFHNEAMADIMPVEYCTRMIAKPDSRGWLQSFVNETHGIEDASLANPAVQDALKNVAQRVLKASGPLSPWWYSLGDENFMHRGFGYSPYGLEYFRKFLHRRYGSIARLNAQHGTTYTNFTEVPRYRNAGAVAVKDIPALLDHELAVDDEWAGMHQFLADEIRRSDPGARVGAEGSEAGNMDRMLQGTQVWAPYAGQGELLRSLGPDKLRSHWWGHYIPPAPDAGELWRWLFEGKANFQEYYASTGVDGILNQNLTYMDYFNNLMPDLQEINNGLGMLLANARVISDQAVVIHYSRESLHASKAFDALASTGASDRVLLEILRARGQDFRYASSRLITTGCLQTPRAKVLFLPASYCLSEAEAAGIAQFVREGGTLVADVLPGVLNEYGSRRMAAPLAEVFGVHQTGAAAPTRAEDLVVTGDLWGQQITLGLGAATYDAAIALQGGTALATVNGTPVLIKHEYGKGRVILFNVDLARAPKAMSAQLVAACLGVAGVTPAYRLEGLSASTMTFAPVIVGAPGETGGDRGPAARVSVLQQGGVELVGIVLPSAEPQETCLVWDQPRHAYNARTGEYLGKVNQLTLAPLPPTAYGKRAQVYLISLQDYPLKGIAISAPSTVKRGGMLSLTVGIDMGRTNPDGRLLRIDVIDPAGRHVKNLRGFLTLRGMKGQWHIPFAFNDAPGAWTVRVTDLVTGVHAVRTVRLR